MLGQRGQAMDGAVVRHLFEGERVLAVGRGELTHAPQLRRVAARTLMRLTRTAPVRLIFTDRRVLLVHVARAAVWSFDYEALRDLDFDRGRLAARLSFIVAGRPWRFSLPRGTNDIAAIVDALQGGGALLRAA